MCLSPPTPPQVGGNINILAEADPSLLRPATAAEEALYAQLQRGREEKEAAEAAAAAAAAGQDGAAVAASGDGSSEGAEAMQAGQQPGEGAAPAAPAGDAQPQQTQQQQQQGRWAAAPHAGRCYYTPLPRLVKRGGLTPQELTGACAAGLGVGTAGRS